MSFKISAFIEFIFTVDVGPRTDLPKGVPETFSLLTSYVVIVGVADDHKDIDAIPNPACLFMGFGDSSFDFQLRAWTAEVRHMRVASDLRFGIFKSLAEAGIKIPFPQRDIYVRTADTVDASIADAEKQEKAPEPGS